VSARRQPIPQHKRALEKARRMAADLWRDVAGKPRPRKTAKRNPRADDEETAVQTPVWDEGDEDKEDNAQ
jgi:hypothetical protein